MYKLLCLLSEHFSIWNVFYSSPMVIFWKWRHSLVIHIIKCTLSLFFVELVSVGSDHPFNFIVFFLRWLCWHVLWWQGIHVSDCAAGSQSLSPSQTWPLSLRLRLPAWPMCFHDPPGTSYLPWSLPSKSLILLTMASRSWMSWHFHLWGTHLFCGYFAFAFSNFNHVWFLSFLISMEGEVVLSLPFTRWSCDFKESPHIKIPFLCNIILIEMLILWKENDG